MVRAILLWLRSGLAAPGLLCGMVGLGDRAMRATTSQGAPRDPTVAVEDRSGETHSRGSCLFRQMCREVELGTR